jgi:hypothetical protein
MTTSSFPAVAEVLSQRWASPFEGTRDVVVEVTVE